MRNEESYGIFPTTILIESETAKGLSRPAIQDYYRSLRVNVAISSFYHSLVRDLQQLDLPLIISADTYSPIACRYYQIWCIKRSAIRKDIACHMALRVHVTRFHLTNHGAGVLRVIRVSVSRDSARLPKLLIILLRVTATGGDSQKNDQGQITTINRVRVVKYNIL